MKNKSKIIYELIISYVHKLCISQSKQVHSMEFYIEINKMYFLLLHKVTHTHTHVVTWHIFCMFFLILPRAGGDEKLKSTRSVFG